MANVVSGKKTPPKMIVYDFLVPKITNMKIKRKKVILVEDNKAAAGLLEMVFNEQKIDCDLAHFQDGDDLLSGLPVIPLYEICYILLDLNMPKMSGFELLEIFAGHPDWQKLPVIVFSSSTCQSDVDACYDLGANAYVSKPLDFNSLQRIVQVVHGFWGQVNQGPFLP